MSIGAIDVFFSEWVYCLILGCWDGLLCFCVSIFVTQNHCCEMFCRQKELKLRVSQFLLHWLGEEFPALPRYKLGCLLTISKRDWTRVCNDLNFLWQFFWNQSFFEWHGPGPLGKAAVVCSDKPAWPWYCCGEILHFSFLELFGSKNDSRDWILGI